MDDVRAPTPPEVQIRPPRVHPPAGLTEEDRRWMAENREAIEAFNRWDEEHGSPLDIDRTV